MVEASREGKNNSLLLLPESKKTDTRHLDHLETHTGDISLGLAAATETRDEDLVVLVGKVQATVIGDESLFMVSWACTCLARPGFDAPHYS